VRLVAEERAGSPLLDDFRPQLLHAGLYHADGQQLGEVFEYGSFRQSLMYQRGVRCTDCHDAHAGRLRAEGNALCTRCHGVDGDPRFPALTRRAYDSPSHHVHPARSRGAACVACHMPARTFMRIDARRDHRLSVPRPDLSAKLGTPNACTACHAGRSARWAADAIRRWYGPRRASSPDRAETIAAGRAGARRALPGLLALALEPAQPAIVRGTALDLLRGYGAAGVPAMVRATTDDDPVVRVAAVAGLDRLPPEERVRTVAPLLRDPIRAVRIEAARVLAPVPRPSLTAIPPGWLEDAATELRASYEAMADMPATRVDAGLLHEALGERDRAEREYRTALGWDPYLVPARMALANVLEAAGETAGAESTLREGLGRSPASGDLRYGLGLLLADRGRLREAAGELARAVRLMPDRARVRYNQGLLLQAAGRPREAEAALLGALALDGEDPDILYALAFLYLERRDDRRAAIHARRLFELWPDDARAHRLAERLRPAR
jgi:predicted CXXCH cytochrome family protein